MRFYSFQTVFEKEREDQGYEAYSSGLLSGFSNFPFPVQQNAATPRNL